MDFSPLQIQGPNDQTESGNTFNISNRSFNVVSFADWQSPTAPLTASKAS